MENLKSGGRTRINTTRQRQNRGAVLQQGRATIGICKVGNIKPSS
jgi:hypothetical protein